VRLRSSVAAEPRSGTTVGVFIPTELIERPQISDWTGPEHRALTPMEEPASSTTTTHRREDVVGSDVVGSAARHADPSLLDQAYRNGSESPQDEPLLPQRDPGASGIVGVPEPPAEVPPEPRAPANTSAFFSSREQTAEQQGPAPAEQWDAPPAARDELPETAPDEHQPTAARARPPSSPLGDTDVIFQRMVSEWLVDPSDLMEPFQSWESVWDSGWAAAAQAEEAPVGRHTEQGLPVREPGARLVPGSAESPSDDWPNGTGHHRADDDYGVAHGADGPIVQRDPDAVRASLSSHRSGVRAGRSHAREDGPDWGQSPASGRYPHPLPGEDNE
jgi:hypothetical protein